jgi:hypothetical protein
MSHEIIDNIYFIYDAEGNVIFQVELTAEPNNQIVIKTPKEVYAGPIDFISFSENIQK